MKFIISLLFVLIALNGFGQQDTSKVDSFEGTITIPNILKLHDPFLSAEAQENMKQWESFEFYLFNRWGELMAESNDWSFKLEDCLKVEENQLAEGVYVWKIEVKNNKGKKNEEKKEFIGHATYLGHVH